MAAWISVPQLQMKLECSGILESFQYGFLNSTKMSLIKIQIVLTLQKMRSDRESVVCTLLDLLPLSLLLIITR